MARARNLKPALFKNEILGVADPMLTLLFEGLWLLADREGRLEDRVLRIKAELFPYREGIDVNSMLNWLNKNGFIVRYTAGDSSFIQIENFVKHQNPHKNEVESEIPCVSDGCVSSVLIASDTDFIGTAPADSLSLDSLSLDSLTPSLAPVDDDLFPKFWNLYPNKKGKEAAQKAWKKLKVTDDLFSLITSGLAKQVVCADWIKDAGQFIPHPSTWLNGKRWEDEVKTPSNVHPFQKPAAVSRHLLTDTRDYREGTKENANGTFRL
jgi:hypothetical protein